MPYLLIDAGMPDNPKVEGLTDRAFRLWITTLVYCARNLTNGAISPVTLVTTAHTIKLRRKKRVVEELVSAGLWEVTDEGWQIHDYLEYNPSRDEMDRKRSLARERKRRHDKKSNASGNTVTNAVSNASQDPQRGSLKRPPIGAAPTGSNGQGTRSTSPPPKDTTPEPDVERAPPPTELLEMFGIQPPPNPLPPEPEPDEQDAELIAYYSSQDPSF